MAFKCVVVCLLLSLLWMSKTWAQELILDENTTETLKTMRQSVVSGLLEVLKDNDREVRWHAAEALGRIGLEAQAAIPALTEALNDENWEVRWTAAMALVNIGS